jgi:putative peptidoglycan lipid II flippase
MLPDSSQIKYYENLEALIFLAWIGCGIQILNGCLSAMLNSQKKYLYTACLGLGPYLGIIGLLTITPNFLGIEVMLFGLILGAGVSAALSIFLLRKNLFPIFLKEILWGEIFKLFYRSPFTAIAMSCFSAYAVVDAYWAPQIGDGVLASLGYSQRIIIGIGNLAIAGVSAVVIPHIADLNKTKNYIGSREIAVQSLITVMIIAGLLALGIYFYSEYIVEALFGSTSFGAIGLSMVSELLQHMSLGFIAMLLSVISMRLLFCFQEAGGLAALLGLGWTAMYFFFSMLWFPSGAKGLANAYSASWVITSGIIIFIVYRKYKRLIL